MPKHITLIGMMGSGKSTVAPLIAAPLKRPVLEVDKLIEEQEGMTINDIFIAKGEAYFRRAESELLQSLLRLPVGRHAQTPAQEHRRLLPLRHRGNPRLPPPHHPRRAPAAQHPRPRRPRHRARTPPAPRHQLQPRPLPRRHQLPQPPRRRQVRPPDARGVRVSSRLQG
jgi:hypothetical protein